MSDDRDHEIQMLESDIRALKQRIGELEEELDVWRLAPLPAPPTGICCANGTFDTPHTCQKQPPDAKQGEARQDYKSSPVWAWIEAQHKAGTIGKIPLKYGNDIFAWWIQITELYASSVAADRDALRSALRKYGDHKKDCGKYNDPTFGRLAYPSPDLECTCGYYKALEGADQEGKSRV